VNREEAENHYGPELIELARILYEKMEHLDPGCCGGADWEDLPEFDIGLYAIAVREILSRPDLIILALRDHDMERWRAELGEKLH